MVLQNLGKKNQFLICHTFVNTLCVRYGMLSGAIHAKCTCKYRYPKVVHVHCNSYSCQAYFKMHNDDS